MQAKLESFPFSVHTFGEEEFPPGSYVEIFSSLASKTGLDALRYVIEIFTAEANVQLRDGPPLLNKLKPDCIIVDQVYAALAALARHLSIPYISTCNAMCLTDSPGIPSAVSTRIYTGTFLNRLISRVESHFLRFLAHSITNSIRAQQRVWKEPLSHSTDDLDSSLAVIAQLLPSFDFPRQLPPHFHLIGRFSNPTNTEPLSHQDDFDWTLLRPGKKLIYASLGTVQNGVRDVYDNIASACVGLDVDLVIALGNRDATPWKMPGDPIVLPFAQERLIAKADLVITHAGLNTAMTCLVYGKPMVAIPVANDQPAVSARIVYSGVGRRVLLNSLSVDKLREEIKTVLGDDSFREKAEVMRDETKGTGVVRAADVIEEVVRTGEPVSRDWQKGQS